MDKLVTKENIQEILYLYFIGEHRSADLCMELAKQNANTVYQRYIALRDIEERTRRTLEICKLLDIPVIER